MDGDPAWKKNGDCIFAISPTPSFGPQYLICQLIKSANRHVMLLEICLYATLVFIVHLLPAVHVDDVLLTHRVIISDNVM